MRSEVRNQSQRGSWAAKRLTLDLRFKPHVGLHAGHGAYLKKEEEKSVVKDTQEMSVCWQNKESTSKSLITKKKMIKYFQFIPQFKRIRILDNTTCSMLLKLSLSLKAVTLTAWITRAEDWR